MKTRYWIALGVVTVLFTAFVYVQFAGSAVVIDETGRVRSASIVTGDGRTQPLHQLWDGYFYAIPNLEGSIELRCDDGVTKQWGYVTGHMHTEIRVVGRTSCAQVVHG